MRYFVLSILIPFWLSSVSGQAFGGGFKPQVRIVKNSPEAEQEDQKNVTIKLLQQQVNLLSRIEKSLNSPDPNQIRAVRGQLTLQVHAVEHFLQMNYPNYQVLCTSSVTSVTSNAAQAQVYCSLSAYNEELFKLSPILDQLLARRGELALVRPLPLVSGERQLHSVLTIAPIQRPQLSQPAIPFNHEPDLPPTKIPIIGLNAKTPIANYVPPLQPAIVPPPAALTIIQTARNLLAQAESVFTPNQLLNSPTATSNNDTYALNPQFLRTYSQFLSLPNTGIVRILPDKIYHHSPNTLQNRLQPSQHPFARLLPLPNFAPQLALAIESEQFQLVSSGIDYGFMTDLGDMPLEKLDAGLTNIPQLTRTSFLNYRPPQQLEALQLDKRRFLLASLQNQLLPKVPAVLQHTYLMRTLQFQLPEIIVNSQPVSRQDRSHQGELLQTQSSDLILAFRPVYRHPDGSYTVLWRVLSQFRDPQIDDLEQYVKFE